MIVSHYMGQGMKRDTALDICGVSKHQFYYHPEGNKKAGRAPSTQTQQGDQLIDNSLVVDQIKDIQSCEDTHYGYRKMTFVLCLMGMIINHKKVYRLMKEADLLKEKFKPGAIKEYAQYRIVTPERPLHVIEMDIKMVWVEEHKRHAYILNIIDTFTRTILYWSVGYHMKQQQVKKAWEHIIIHHLQPNDLLHEQLHVELRNDNGPQFSATSVKEYLQENHIKQTFTHPYTPQENGHVESFHNILKNALGKNVYWSLTDLEERLERFYINYNQKRIHSSIANLPPMVFWKCWEENLIERIEVRKRRVKFKLKISYQQLSGIKSLKEVLCAENGVLDGLGFQKQHPKDLVAA